MKKLLSVLFILFIAGSLYGQSADKVTEILESPEVTFGQVCYISAVCQGFISEDGTYTQAIDALYKRKQIPAPAYETDAVAMVNLAYIYSQIWNVKGGLMFILTKGSPRYAFKQFKADGVIPNYVSPGKIVSGQEALNIFSACEIEYGGLVLSVE